MKIVSIVLFFLSAAGPLRAQNLTGFWKGTLNMSSGCFGVNNIEFQLQVSGDSVYGYSYHYENVNHYVKKKLSGRYDRSQKKLYLREGTVITYHIPPGCNICVKNFELSYRKEGKIEVLTGGWNGKILDTQKDCSTGPITLTRARESDFKEVPEIVVDTGTIRLDFYDNAQVDGDSITVLVNKNIVVSHQRLSTKPITTYITIDLHNTFQEVEMVAENLGSIPPNTAMLVITAGEKKYQLFLTSTESKSAMVRFVYEK
ncbi:MAG TPA: hypothetical protein VFR58_01160 [Flavisolibacter sp.]|nr:hypothetical protein [Flavisolibacter sp.]